MTVRSTVLGAVSLAASTNTTLFTCPAGFTAILKTLWMQNLSGASASVTVWVGIPGVGNFEIFQNSSTPAGVEAQLQTWVVLLAGHQLVAYSSQANISIHASGSLLQGVPA